MTGPVAQEIAQLLTAAFAPTSLEVINDSASHHGHAGNIDDCAGHHCDAQANAVGDCADRRLRYAPDDVLDCDRQGKVGGAQGKVTCDRRQEQAKALAQTHAEAEQHGAPIRISRHSVQS